MIRRVVDAVVPDVFEAPQDGKQYARKDGGWEEVVASGGGSSLVAEVLTTGFNTTVTFNDLDINTDKNYELEFCFSSNTATDLSLRVNGIATTDYQCVKQSFGGSASAGLLSGHFIGTVDDSYRCDASLKISLNAVKSECVSVISYDPAGFKSMSLLPSGLLNITQISIVASVTNGIGEGTFRLYKKAL